MTMPPVQAIASPRPVASPPAGAVSLDGDGSDRLPRLLGFWATTAVVVGTMIGSGIFRVARGVADQVGSVPGIMAAWALGGVVTLCGALTLAELAAAFPRSGGVFVYLREAYGPAVAFLYGWTMLLLGPAATAGVAVVFAEYFGTLAGIGATGTRLVASAAVVVVSVAGYRSLRGMSTIQNVATLGKVAAITALVVAAFVLGDGGSGALGRGAPPAGSAHWGGIGFGLVIALWAYNGFQDMVSVAGEVRDPGRVLPRALLVGTAGVVLVYLLANAAYLYVLPYSVLRQSPLVATETAVRLFGAAGSGLVAGMVMVSTFGTVNAGVLVYSRVYYAMAVEGLLFAPLGRVHARYRTPHVAVALVGTLAVLFVWLRSFEQLAEAVVVGVFPFLAAAAAGVLLLRRRRPELPRPYRTPGYPFVPLLFIGATAWVFGSALVADPMMTLQGAGFSALGIPVYLVWRRAAGRP